LFFGLMTSAVLLGAALLSLALNLPVTGDDGAAGLRLRDAVTLAVDDLRSSGARVKLIAPAGAGAVENAHQDEGTDNSVDVEAAPAIARAAARANARILIGPLRTNVAVAQAPALRRLHEVAISGTAGGPSDSQSPVFRLTPSEHQLAELAYRTMRRSFGARICVLDDVSDDGERRARIMSTFPGVMRGDCVRRADAVYFSTTSREPVFCSARTALRANPHTLLIEISHRGFDPTAFAAAGQLFRATASPIARTAALLAVAQRYHAHALEFASDDALRTYAAVQVAAQVLSRTNPGADLARALRTESFSTVLGPIRFTQDGDPVAPAMRVVRVN
jgi:ABC-type branched-subunit amino acid transport system substrate-binding protein